ECSGNLQPPMQAATPIQATAIPTEARNLHWRTIFRLEIHAFPAARVPVARDDDALSMSIARNLTPRLRAFPGEAAYRQAAPTSRGGRWRGRSSTREFPCPAAAP